MDIKSRIISLYTSQDYSECLQLISTAPAEIESTAQVQMIKASCMINGGGTCEEAHKILDQIIALDPTNGLAYYSKGVTYMKEMKLTESVEYFTKASEFDTKGAIGKAQMMKITAEKMLKDKNKVTEKKKIVCNDCGKVFAQAYSLSRHRLIHTGERPFKCEICSAGFIQKSDLLRHMSIHQDVAIYNCNKCEKKFKTKKNLKSHSVIHCDFRPFKCKYCTKDFKYKRLLKFHEGIHDEIKRYNCDLCGKGFPSKPNMKSHLRTHIKRRNQMLLIKDRLVMMKMKKNNAEKITRNDQLSNPQIKDSDQNKDNSASESSVNTIINLDNKNEVKKLGKRKVGRPKKYLDQPEEEKGLKVKLTKNKKKNTRDVPPEIIDNTKQEASVDISPTEHDISGYNNISLEQMKSYSLNQTYSSFKDQPTSDLPIPISSNQPTSVILDQPTITDIQFSSFETIEVTEVIEVQVKKEPLEIEDSIGSLASNDANFIAEVKNEKETPEFNEWSLFFQSLLPDLNKMDDRQKRKFKQQTFKIIDEILE